jgi:hypothetical protein
MANLNNLSEKPRLFQVKKPTLTEKNDFLDFEESSFKHNKRLERLSSHKKRTRALSAYLKDRDKIDVPFYQKLHSCYDYLLFKDYVNLKKIKIGATHSCQVHLLCPMCAIVRAAKQVQLYESKFQELKRKFPKLSIYYVVLTVKNREDLSECYEHLHASLQKLIRRRREASMAKNGRKSSAYALNSCFANVIAGAYSIEVKRGENSKAWHPHANLLLLSEDVIYESEIKKEWKLITKDSQIAYCSVKDDEDKTVFVEIFKYALKFSEMAFDDNFLAWKTLRGRRLMGSFGEFRGLDVEKEDTELSLKDEPYLELFYRYEPTLQQYALHKKTSKDPVLSG